MRHKMCKLLKKQCNCNKCITTQAVPVEPPQTADNTNSEGDRASSIHTIPPPYARHVFALYTLADNAPVESLGFAFHTLAEDEPIEEGDDQTTEEENDNEAPQRNVDSTNILERVLAEEHWQGQEYDGLRRQVALREAATDARDALTRSLALEAFLDETKQRYEAEQTRLRLQQRMVENAIHDETIRLLQASLGTRG
jgi:hypothetical protein